MDFNTKSYLKRQMAFYSENHDFEIKDNIKKEVDESIPIVNFNLDLPECNKDCKECKLSKKLQDEYETETAKCIQQ